MIPIDTSESVLLVALEENVGTNSVQYALDQINSPEWDKHWSWAYAMPDVIRSRWGELGIDAKIAVYLFAKHVEFNTCWVAADD